jgi:hypothetical protein
MKSWYIRDGALLSWRDDGDIDNATVTPTTTVTLKTETGPDDDDIGFN